MKSKYLLSALALSAAFVACNNEDVMVNEQTGTNEVVGAKLLGKGLSLNLSNGSAESRATATAWEVGDLAGLGWVVYDEPGALQTGVELSSTGNTLYGNHFYQYTESGWNTRTNIYEGWHFAYRPYTHQSKPGELSIVVNEKVYAGGIGVDAMNNAPYISAAAFLNEDNVNTANGTIEEKFVIQRVANALYPTLIIEDAIKEHEDLKDIAITGITVGVTDKALFYENIKVVPSKLPVNVYGEDGKVNDEETLVLLNDSSLYGVGALSKDKNVRSISTTVEENMFKLDADQQMRIFLAPVRDLWFNKANLYFRIDVTGGHFNVVYTNPASLAEGEVLTEIQEQNNEAIDKLYALMRTGWEDQEGDILDIRQLVQNKIGFDLGLGKENFVADYLIEDIDDWKGSVTLANALCGEGEVPTFTLVDGADVVFTDEITAPENHKVNVVCENANNYSGWLTVAGELTWNENIQSVSNGAAVRVGTEENNAAELTVEGILTPVRMRNYGTIYAGDKSTIGTSSGFENFNRVIVEYGAYVDPVVGKEGTIAYEVPAEYSIAKINTLIKGGTADGAANVNTLIVNEGVDLACVHTTPGVDTPANTDRYNPTDAVPGEATSKVVELTGIALEINKGKVSAPADYAHKAANVTMNGGEMTNVDITGDLIVESGENTIANAMISGKVTVAQGAELTLSDVNIAGNLENDGTTTINGEGTIEIANIINDGTLNANTDVVVKTIAVNSGSKANVAEENTIWYTIPQIEGGYIQKGTTAGQILFYGTAQFLAELEAAEDGATVTLNSDVEMTAPVTIDKDITIDLNGKTWTFNNSATADYAIRNYGKLVLENGKIVGNGTSFAPGLYNEGEAVLNCNIISENSNAIKVDKGGKLTINGGYYESKNPTGQALRVGNYASGQASAWELYINGGEFKGTWAGLYIVNNYDGLATAGKAVIKNAKFTGSTGVVDSGVNGSDIVFDKVKNVTISNCELTTTSIHSETTGESVINEKTINVTTDVYSTLFN